MEDSSHRSLISCSSILKTKRYNFVMKVAHRSSKCCLFESWESSITTPSIAIHVQWPVVATTSMSMLSKKSCPRACFIKVAKANITTGWSSWNCISQPWGANRLDKVKIPQFLNVLLDLLLSSCLKFLTTYLIGMLPSLLLTWCVTSCGLSPNI